MLETLLNALGRRRWLTLLGAVSLFVVSLAAIPRLALNDSPERWMPASSVRAWQRFDEHFDVGDTIAVGLEFHRAPEESDLDFLRRLRTDLEQASAGIKRVYDVSLVIDLVEQVPLLTLIAPPTAETHNKAGADPFELYRGALFDDPSLHGPEDAGRTLVTFVELHNRSERAGEDRDDMRRRAVEGVYRVLDKHRRLDVTFHTVGGIVIQYELERIARRLAATFLPLSLLLGLGAIGLGFRSPAALSIAVLGGVWSVALMLGGVAVAGWTLDVVTVGGPTLMAVIIVATTVHFAHHHAQGAGPHALPPTERPEGGWSPAAIDEARAHVVRWVAVPCLGAGMTTGIGFFMLTFNELGPVRELGFELFAGALLAFFGVFLAWLAVGRFRAAPPRILTARRLDWVQQISRRRPRSVVMVMVIALLGLLAATAPVRIDADPFAFFHPDSRVAKGFAHFSDRHFGIYNLEVVLVPRDGQIDRDDFDAARRFEQSILERPEGEVRKVISTPQFSERLRSLRLVDFRRGVLFVKLFTGWATDLQDSNALRFTFMAHDPGTGFRPLIGAVRAALPTDRFDCFYTGAVAQVVLLSEGLIGGIAKGLSLALVVMALVCVVLFQSIRLAAIAFLPNAFPVVTVFGSMGTFGLPLNSGTAMVATIALGIALNDTVHFLLHYRRCRQEGDGVDQAVERTFTEIGRPIVLTSIVNAAGFSIFLVSDFRPLYHFGLLSSVAMGAALVGDLLLLPALLRTFDRAPVPVPNVTRTGDRAAGEAGTRQSRS